MQRNKKFMTHENAFIENPLLAERREYLFVGYYYYFATPSSPPSELPTRPMDTSAEVGIFLGKVHPLTDSSVVLRFVAVANLYYNLWQGCAFIEWLTVISSQLPFEFDIPDAAHDTTSICMAGHEKC